MTASHTQKLLPVASFIGLLLGGLACAHKLDVKKLDGSWECKTAWTWNKKDGTTAPCSAEAHITCRDGSCSMTGVLSLGDAQWDETSEGTLTVDGEELAAKRTSVKTVPKNDAARQFEKERLGGRGLSGTQPDGPTTHSLRVLKLTRTQFIHVNAEGRTTTCNRP